MQKHFTLCLFMHKPSIWGKEKIILDFGLALIRFDILKIHLCKIKSLINNLVKNIFSKIAEPPPRPFSRQNSVFFWEETYDHYSAFFGRHVI